MNRHILVIALLTAGCCAPATAQDAKIGQHDFMESCAVCHGKGGRGDGPMADQLLKKPADLTRLAQRNGGEFPFRSVVATIDGRHIVPGHGEREMPIWGRKFLEGDQRLYGPHDKEVLTEERISELAQYIRTLQRQ